MIVVERGGMHSVALKIITYRSNMYVYYTDIEHEFILMSTINILGIQSTDEGNFGGITPA